MPQMKMSAKCPRRERLPSSSSYEEEDPQIKRFDCYPVLLGKNVDIASFTFDAPSFYIEDLFIGMGWVGILTLNDKEQMNQKRPSSSTFSFTEDHFNLLNGRIDLLTSSVEGLHQTAEDLRLTMGTLQQSVDRMTSLLQALHSRLDAMIPPPPPPDF
ncbi:hypothetical protein Adt_14596 [Abeliophyllum distichum]|uniref:Uncharacterized protein n=1 Tax=Abeliophyllum distichum TaxID=126358 RepID=A0ABD1U026_9LAMI